MTDYAEVLWGIGGFFVYTGLWSLGIGSVLALIAVLYEAAGRLT